MDSNYRSNTGTGKSSAAAAPQLTGEAAAEFQQGINLLLSRWTALQMAVQSEWGGPQSRLKSQQLELDLFSLLAGSKERVYMDDVEDLLDDSMLSLGTEIADGSIEEIAEKLMFMHEECLKGDFSSIQRLRATNPPPGAATHVTQIQASSDSDSDDNEDSDNGNGPNDGSSKMVVDVPQSHSVMNREEMMVDESIPQEPAETEDGWTVVASKRNREGILSLRGA
ncbi:uncharacterized protein [Coffea arabica]|uniref:Uncharacterized protein isoform X3 n=1 Tax=Coffea arabica TaxID=13443 RepID=A0A6P6SYH7_COFAR|nr:pre-rRNA-processing protein TSR2-like isoform X3 [Coffea arabica]XP_027071083.1 pre-rRNA-processing protein TSR2-like isoform X3 [Coffea arabica]